MIYVKIYTLNLTYRSQTKQKINISQKVIGHDLPFSQYLPISDLSEWLCPLGTQNRITTSFNRDLIATVCSPSAPSLEMNQTRVSSYVCECLRVQVMLKMQSSHNLQYIALGGEGGAKGCGEEV